MTLDDNFVEGVRQILIDEYREKYHSEPSRERILKRLNEVIKALNIRESK